MRTGRRLGGHAHAAMLLAVTALTVAPAAAGDTRPRAPRPAAAPAFDIKALEQRVRGPDPAEVLAALAEARDAGPTAAAAAPIIEDLLRRGATLPIMKAALEALRALAQPSSSPAIRPYIQHRDPDIRREAARALTETRGPDATAALRAALRSNDGMLRGLAAAGLGTVGALEALPDLFLALDRDIPEAATSIGQLCDPKSCRRLLDRMGTIDFAVMTSALDGILLRPPSRPQPHSEPPLPEDLLLDVVRRVRDLATPEAGRYLADIAARWPASASPRVKSELDAASRAVPAAAPAAPESAP